MVRTQIQLPDRLHRRLKAVAEREETSLADVIRRAGECYLAVHPETGETQQGWSPPEAVDMGRLLAPESSWRELANELTESELRARLR
jgi:predicted transcriptional regulator